MERTPFVKLAWFTAAVVMASPASAEQFDLVCRGVGVGRQSSVTSGTVFSANGTPSTVSAVTSTPVPTPGTARVKIADKRGSILLPDFMVPVIHGGSDGWFTISDLAVSDGSITGKLKVGTFSHPKFAIDRRTGVIHIDGWKDGFNGDCAPYEEGQNARKF